jgi:UDP-N-acetylglucosamine 2-epimerase (non-hydrolysing)
MIDSLHYSLRKLPPRADPGTAAPYAVATLHRPSNVDDPVKLAELLDGLVHVGRTLPVFFPAHPRTRAAIERYGLGARLEAASTERHGLGARLVAGGVHVGPPLSYLEFLALWRDAALVVTDSGGIQEETTALGVPCFTLRENTERPITVEEGTNTVLGASGPALVTAFDEFMAGRNRKTGRVPHLWDGRAAERILDVIVASLSAGA